MDLPAGDGLAVVYVLADRWRRERDTLAALGVEEPDRIGELVRTASTTAKTADRAAQIAAFADAMGGEFVGGP